MKTLLIAFSLMLTMVACNKDAKTEYNQQREEANQDFREEMRDVNRKAQEAKDDHRKEINDAKKDLQEERHDEMHD